MALKKLDIAELMTEIVDLENGPSVFSVSLQKTDHRDSWLATAVIRGDHRNLSVDHSDPVQALEELRKVIMSLICPTCHLYQPEKREQN